MIPTRDRHRGRREGNLTNLALKGFLGAVLVSGCAGGPPPEAAPKAARPVEAPTWIDGAAVEGKRLCGIGVAGAGYDEHSPYPKRLAEERAVANLAGVLGTQIQEAIVDRATNHGQSIRTARVVTVDEALVEKVQSMAETEFWLDARGVGPFVSKGFMYAHTCIEASVAAKNFNVKAKDLLKDSASQPTHPGRVPAWINRGGRQKDGRLCAVGFSLPTFHADRTFQGVVEDIRVQLALVLETFVSSYFEELATTRGQAFEAITVATNDAVSKGAIVTHYWFDRDGQGPIRQERSTYGYGCVYPVDVLTNTTAQVEKTLEVDEDERAAIARVRENARAAFEDLEGEIEKREDPAPTVARAEDPPAPSPEIIDDAPPSLEASVPGADLPIPPATGGAEPGPPPESPPGGPSTSPDPTPPTTPPDPPEDPGADPDSFPSLEPSLDPPSEPR